MSNVYPLPPNSIGRSFLDGSGGPPHDGDMEVLQLRMTAVETRLDKIDGRLDGIDNRLRGVEIKLGEIGGKIDLLVGKIPSWWQPPASIIAVLAALVEIVAAIERLGILKP